MTDGHSDESQLEELHERIEDLEGTADTVLAVRTVPHIPDPVIEVPVEVHPWPSLQRARASRLPTVPGARPVLRAYSRTPVVPSSQVR
jgi:hypothetical protein